MITKFKKYENTNPKTLTMNQINVLDPCPNCGTEIDISRYIDNDIIEGTCVGCGERHFKYHSNIQKWKWV